MTLSSHMPASALVTGAAGFAGSHLIDLLAARWRAGHRLASSRWHGATPGPGRGVAGVDLLDRTGVRDAIRRLSPEVVYHCAGASHVGDSWTTTEATLAVNVRATHHLVDGLRIARPAHATGRGQFRDRLRRLPGGAARGCRDSSGKSVRREQAGAGTGRRQRTRRTCTCPLPGRSITSGRARCRVSWPRTSRDVSPRSKPDAVPPEIAVGNLDARRDLTDVRDTVRAYRLIAERGQPGRVYNVCSGRTVVIRDLLDMLLARDPAYRLPFALDPARLRPSDQPVVLGDPSRIRDELGWSAGNSTRTDAGRLAGILAPARSRRLMTEATTTPRRRPFAALVDRRARWRSS